jgi:dipeptide transport system permease protein
MIRFLLSRLALIIPTFIGITIVAFAFVRVLPGDPVLLLAGERGLTPERYAQLSAQFGFDQPLILQYFDYVWGLLQGDLGISITTKRPVLTDFMTLFPATVELGLCAILFAILLGIPAGILAAV